jgi:hypothetical protein
MAMSMESVPLSAESRVQHSRNGGWQSAAIHNSLHGSQTRLPAKLFSLLHFPIFRGGAVFSESLQGFSRGQTPPFLARISYPRWVVAFSQSML